MKKWLRYILQVLLWIGIWFILWKSGGKSNRFFDEHIFMVLFQIGLLYCLIFILIPKLLFKKQYVYFSISVLILITSSTLISSVFRPNHPLQKHEKPFDHPYHLPDHHGDHHRPPEGVHPPKPHRPVPLRLLIFILMISISSILAILLELVIYAQNKEKSFALAKAELIESELKFLKMQINPHFLFNALNNIYSLSVLNSIKTQESISTLSDMLRYVIYDCEQPKVTLQKEIEYIENYIQMFQMKSEKQMDITFKKRISTNQTLVSPMLFVPFLENAFKHSGVELFGDNFIKIVLKQTDSNIELVIKNSFPNDIISKDKQGGIGLKNVRKRLGILYPNRHKLTILQEDAFFIKLILYTHE